MLAFLDARGFRKKKPNIKGHMGKCNTGMLVVVTFDSLIVSVALTKRYINDVK